MEAGNVKAMREALENLVYNIETRAAAFDIFFIVDRKTWIDAKAALAAPPRNCDVGTAEEQAERMRLYCNSHGVDESGCFRCEKCPFLTDERCELDWSQMPYEEKEGEKHE